MTKNSKTFGWVLLIISALLSHGAQAQRSRGANDQGTVDLRSLEEGAYVQSSERLELKNNLKPLALTDAIEQGLRKSYPQLERNLQFKLLELNWQDTKESFWLPHIGITLSSAEQRIGRFKEGGKNGNQTTLTPAGSLALELGDYTVFNWGKDYLGYLSDKASYLRNSDILKEEKRDLKQDLIIKYFELAYLHENLATQRTQLRHTSFVYRLAREKVTLGKIPKQEYYQARTEYLRAQSEYHEAKNLAAVSDEQMAKLLADPPGTRYILKNELAYAKIKPSVEDGLRLAQNTNPSILTAQVEIENADRAYELRLKENLPLPRFSVNLGAYTHSFGRNQARTVYETRANDSNIELVATLNATWSLTGPGGLLNSRRTEGSLLAKHIALNRLAEAKHVANSNVQELYTTVKYLEDQVQILEARTSNAQKSFDIILENYLNRRATFLDFKHSLDDLTVADLQYEQAKYLHLKHKVLLAKEIGVEDFPGESFEQLAKTRSTERRRE
jgi:outer membrane protein TolC